MHAIRDEVSRRKRKGNSNINKSKVRNSSEILRSILILCLIPLEGGEWARMKSSFTAVRRALHLVKILFYKSISDTDLHKCP